MLALARASAAQAGVTSARFLHGHVEDIPLPDLSPVELSILLLS